jgi:hypothetical protein
MARPLMTMKLRVALGVLSLLLLLMGVPILLMVPEAGIGALFMGGMLALPGLILLMTVFTVPQHDKNLKRRQRELPALPPHAIVESCNDDDITRIPLPLFDRPLANLWSTVVTVRSGDHRLQVAEVIHADLFGEGMPLLKHEANYRTGVVRTGNLTVSCAFAEVAADIPLIVVRPRAAKPTTWPDDLVERKTELESFNRSFRVLARDPYAATAAVDARTIEAIGELDPRFSIEMGGRWVMVYSPELDGASMGKLIEQAARLMDVFPRVVSSLFPALPLPSPSGR